jgi:hypothetical protein
MSKDAKIESKVPLASNFELATLAVQMAQLSGKDEPDIIGAIKLLRATARRLKHEVMPTLDHIPIMVTSLPVCEKERSAFLAKDPDAQIVSPKDEPGYDESVLAKIASVPGSEEIKEPKRFPATLRQIAVALFKQRSTRRLTALLRQVTPIWKWNQKLHPLDARYANDRYTFWCCISVMQHLAPKYRHLYTADGANGMKLVEDWKDKLNAPKASSASSRKRARKGPSKGAYASQERGDGGKWAKKTRGI